MSLLSFIFSLLCLISIDCFLTFIILIFYKYYDLKYFSTSEVELLKQENEYLKNENKKINGTSTYFWDK